MKPLLCEHVDLSSDPPCLFTILVGQLASVNPVPGVEDTRILRAC